MQTNCGGFALAVKTKEPIKTVETSSKIETVVQLLESEFGIPNWRRKDPLDELILTILSQNTNDRNRDNGYVRLRNQFPTWAEVLDAPISAIEEAIRPAGLSNQKSTSIKGALAWVKERFGSLSLQGLRSLENDEVIQLLTSQKGVGVKTAAVLLAFSLDRDLCPVDTHVHRIALRLGWVKEGTSAEKTFTAIRSSMPEGKAASFHLNLLKFGRTICTARSPKCEVCPLWDDCQYLEKKPQPFKVS